MKFVRVLLINHDNFYFSEFFFGINTGQNDEQYDYRKSEKQGNANHDKQHPCQMGVQYCKKIFNINSKKKLVCINKTIILPN